MTHTTTVVEDGNAGDHDYVIADVDITSLGSAGSESFNPETELGLRSASGGEVLQQENPGYQVAVTQTNDIGVKYADYDASSDGVLIDVPSTTDIGVVRIRFVGDFGP